MTFHAVPKPTLRKKKKIIINLPSFELAKRVIKVNSNESNTYVVGTHLKRLTEALLMSFHNIRYVDLEVSAHDLQVRCIGFEFRLG